MIDLPQKIVNKVGRWVCHLVLLEKDRESVRFVRIEGHIPSA